MLCLYTRCIQEEAAAEPHDDLYCYIYIVMHNTEEKISLNDFFQCRSSLVYTVCTCKHQPILMTIEEVMPVPYLSPAAALRGVELQAQQASAHHVQPVDVHHVLSILVLVAEDTDTHKPWRHGYTSAWPTVH